MSTPGLLLIREEVEVGDPDMGNEPAAESPFSAHWRHLDPVDGVLRQLEEAGRGHEAELIKAVLAHAVDDIVDDQAIKAYVSTLWAEDWNSEEDALYDRM
jgi:hypothetical protein